MTSRWVKNFDALATSPARRDALGILESGYDLIQTDRVIRSSVSVTDDAITIRGQHFDTKGIRDIYLLGFGKGSCAAVYALHKILSARLKKTIVIDRTLLGICPDAVEAFVGTHPLPSIGNVVATKAVIGVAEAAGEDDLVLVVVAGGGSSLLCSSYEECDDSIRLFEKFQHMGADIRELNTVRKHISRLKGGGLAEMLHPARVVGLVFSDIVGGNPEEVASGPTYPDSSTNDDAHVILKKYGLERAFTLRETSKNPQYFERVSNIVLISNEDAIREMAKTAESFGYEHIILREPLYDLPQVTLEKLFENSAPGRVVFGGGEIEVRVPQNAGAGGRCQFLALEVLPMLMPDDVFVAAASDGRDNSDKAGAIVDRGTMRRIVEQNIDLAPHRARMDTLPVFEKTGDSITTGTLQANVSDWYFLLSPR
jgi:glycerate-2-kinase